MILTKSTRGVARGCTIKDEGRKRHRIKPLTEIELPTTIVAEVNPGLTIYLGQTSLTTVTKGSSLWLTVNIAI